jgi:hypothetical protein
MDIALRRSRADVRAGRCLFAQMFNQTPQVNESRSAWRGRWAGIAARDLDEFFFAPGVVHHH